MTGFASKDYELKEEDDKWRTILAASNSNQLMCCDCAIKNNLKQNDYDNKRLIINHSYSVLKAIEFNVKLNNIDEKHKLILIKNP